MKRVTCLQRWLNGLQYIATPWVFRRRRRITYLLLVFGVTLFMCLQLALYYPQSGSKDVKKGHVSGDRHASQDWEVNGVPVRRQRVNAIPDPDSVIMYEAEEQKVVPERKFILPDLSKDDDGEMVVNRRIGKRDMPKFASQDGDSDQNNIADNVFNDRKRETDSNNDETRNQNFKRRPKRQNSAYYAENHHTDSTGNHNKNNKVIHDETAHRKLQDIGNVVNFFEGKDEEKKSATTEKSKPRKHKKQSRDRGNADDADVETWQANMVKKNLDNFADAVNNKADDKHSEDRNLNRVRNIETNRHYEFENSRNNQAVPGGSENVKPKFVPNVDHPSEKIEGQWNGGNNLAQSEDYDDDDVEFHDFDTEGQFSILQAEPPSQGEVWPYPYRITYSGGTLEVSQRVFAFVLANGSETCDILNQALARYSRRIFRNLGAVDPENVQNARKMTFGADDESGKRILQKLEINCQNLCGDYPSAGSSESYTLDIGAYEARLKASSVWGVLRGLETFSQLIYQDFHHQLLIRSCRITDLPRFQHRGILIDTARHYISPKVLKQNLDAMEQNKFNVFHWHITDDQSFPFVSEAFPELSQKGAYSPAETYDFNKIKDIIDYARVRGIRIIPEFDTPGHTKSWGESHPEILTNCPDGTPGPLDPIKKETYKFLGKLFMEILSLFPDAQIHLGEDEVSYRCWLKDPNISKYLERIDMYGDYTQLLDLYTGRLTRLILGINPTKEFIFWQEVIENDIKLDKHSIIQLWKNWMDMDFDIIKRITDAGYRMIYSSKWYLNYINYGTDWTEYYLVDPTMFIANRSHHQLMLGGEACMWSEFVDDNNILQTLWPRASAVAERLWSPSSIADAKKAEPRFEEQRCRMIRNGIPAPPNGGPSTCSRTG